MNVYSRAYRSSTYQPVPAKKISWLETENETEEKGAEENLKRTISLTFLYADRTVLAPGGRSSQDFEKHETASGRQGGC